MAEILGGDADAGVLTVTVVLWAAGFEADGDAAVGGVVDGVGDEVSEQAGELVGIALSK